jgi:hypothetical protein
MTLRKFKHLDSPEEVRKTALGEQPMRSNLYGKTTKVLGEVVRYDAKADSYHVITRGVSGDPSQPGGRSLVGVPRRTEDPGMIAPLETGVTVVIDTSLGFPYIEGVLNINASKAKNDATPQPSKLGGAEGMQVSDTQPGDDMPGYYKNINTPEDVMQGDFVRVSPDRNYIAVLRGKETRMYGSAKAQVRVNGLNDLVQVICEDYEHYNGFGTFKISNSEGKGNVEIRGGSDQLSQTGGEEEQWTFQVDIGDIGNIFDLRVTSPEGKTLSQIKLTPDGQILLMATKGVDIVNAGNGPRNEEIGGDRYLRVLGNAKKTVEGTDTNKISGSHVTTVSETDKKIVGSDKVASINRHKLTSIGGNKIETVSGGDPLSAEPTNKAVDVQVLNGSYFIELGNTTSGASPAAMAGFNVFVNNGSVTLGQNPMAKPSTQAYVNLNTLLPNSVALGGTIEKGANMATLHAMLFEPFQAMMKIFLGMLDAHTHQVTMVGAATGPALSPDPGGFSSKIGTSIKGISSTKVKIHS